MENPFIEKFQEVYSAYKRPVELPMGADFHLEKHIKRIYYYHELSRFLTSNVDELGRRKPFKNVVNQVVDIMVRATDPDFSKLLVKSEKKDYTMSNMFRVALKDYAKKTDLSKEINILNEQYHAYGTVVAERVFDEDGKTHTESVFWGDLIVDQNDIGNAPIYKRQMMTAYDLQKKDNIWDVDIVLDKYKQVKAKNPNALIEVYKFEGEFDYSEVFEQENREYGLVQGYIAKVNDFEHELWAEKIEEKDRTFKWAHRTAIPYRCIGRGGVEDGFETQIATNEVAIAEKNAFEITSKVLAKSNASGVINGESMLDMPDGGIFKLDEGEDINMLQLMPSLPKEGAMLEDRWFQNYQRRSSTFESLSGETALANTPFRSLALQSKQGASIHEYKGENFRMFLIDILWDWYIDDIISEYKKDGVLAGDFSAVEFQNMFMRFAVHEVNESAKEKILDRNTIYTQEDYLMDIAETAQNFMKESKDAGFKVPKGYFNDIKSKITLTWDNEFEDRNARVNSLFELWQSLPPEDPNRQTVWDELVEMGGAFSPASFIPMGTSNKAPAAKQEQSAIAQDVAAALPDTQ